MCVLYKIEIYLFIFYLLQACSQKPPTWIGRSFTIAYGFNIFVFVSVLVMGVGFGGWASLSTFIQNYNTYGIFEKCYQCPAIKKV